MNQKLNSPDILKDTAFYIILGLIFSMPLARGAMHPWAWTIMQIGIALSVILLLISSIRTQTPVFEKTPLTRPILALLFLAGISALFSDQKLYAWEGFLLLLTYAGAYFVTQTVVRTRQQKRILVYTIIGTALVLCIIGLLKRFGLNPFTFWNYEELRYHPTWIASTYTNHNHLAGFLEMAIPFAIALFFTRSRPLSIKLLLSYILVILLVSQALTLSRGGWVSTIISMIFMLTILFSQRGFKSKKILAGIVCTAIVIGFFILISTPVVERTLTLSEQDETASMESRIKAWKGTMDMIDGNLWFGTGPGTYEVAFTQYQSPGLGAMFIQAHNDYLQAVSDIGLLALLLLAWFCYAFFKTVLPGLKHPSRQTRIFTLGATACVVAILVHSVSDFNMHIPANALIFAMVAGLAAKIEHILPDKRQT